MIHSAATLRYFLLAGRPRLEPLRVFESTQVPWQDRVFTFCVLGTSHAVLVERDESAFTELLTCAAGEPGGRVLEQRAVGSSWRVTHPIDGVRYHCRVSRFALEAGDRLRGAFASADGLAFSYRTERGTEAPMTRIGWRSDEASLRMETVHTYPREGVGVRSESEFRMSAT